MKWNQSDISFGKTDATGSAENIGLLNPKKVCTNDEEHCEN